MPQYPQRPASYQGRAGSTADLAMGHLELHGPTGEIALAIAIDKEAHELGALLSWPIKQGALRRYVVGDEWVYSMGDGVPLALQQKPPADPPVLDATVTMNASQAGPASDGSQKPNGEGLRSSTVPVKAGSSTPRRSSQHVLKARAETPDATDRDPSAIRSPAGGPMGTGQPAAAGPDDGFRIALWSDGTLEIRRAGGHLVKFSKVESRAIVSYLEAISLDPVRDDSEEALA